MKTSLHILLAALAATVALVSCTKEITPPSFENDKVNPASEGSRVIAVSFAAQPQTKTTLDGFQPKFEDKDSILISNGNAIDTCEVKVESEAATISTNLTGPLTAVYPYKAAGMSDSNPNQIDTVLVSTEQDGKFASANICIARMTGENEESLSFENKTAVFCIKPPTNSPGYVEVSAEGFDIANHIPTGSTNTDYSAIRVPSVTTDSVYVSILVPDGLKVNNLKFSDGTKEKAITTGAQATEEIAAGTLYTVTATDWESPEADIPGALKGVFTVSDNSTPNDPSDDVKVYFSKGNLVATINESGTPTAWKFATNQYDYLGEGGANKTIGSAKGDVDLFGWSTSSTTYGISTSTSESDYSGDFKDWGEAYCESNSIAEGTWRTLSKEEWEYLFNTRTFDGGTGEGKSYQRATINSDATGVYGMILYPDNYTGTAKAFYTSTEWTSLEEAGCVFLPAAGGREGFSVNDVGGRGRYRSSTAFVEYIVYYVDFNSINVSPDDYGSRNSGYSVRLVTDVSAAPGPEQSLVLGPDMIIMKMKGGVPKPGIDDVTYPWIEYVNPNSTLDDGTAEVLYSNRWTNLNPEIGDIGDGTHWLQVTGKNGSANSPVINPQLGTYFIFTVQNVYGMQVFATGSASGSADDGNCLKLTATSDDDEVIEASSTPGGIYGKGTASDLCTINLNPEKSYHIKVEAAVKDIQVTGIKLINEIP